MLTLHVSIYKTLGSHRLSKNIVKVVNRTSLQVQKLSL